MAAHRMRNGAGRHEPPAEERADAAPRAIEKLIGHQNVERPVFFLQAADRARRQDALDAEHLEAVDVGAEIQLRREDAMADAVTREKRDLPAAKTAGHTRTWWIAERRRQRLFCTLGELGHIVQTAPADDSDLNAHVGV